MDQPKQTEVTTLTSKQISELEETLKNFISKVKETGKIEPLQRMRLDGHGSHAQQ